MPLMWRCELCTRLREAVRAPCMEGTASSLNRAFGVGWRSLSGMRPEPGFREAGGLPV